MRKHQHKSNYKEGSLSLIGAVAMGTGVMIGAGIFPGDLVLVHRQPTARSGDIVVALVENEATVKTFKQCDHRVELHPANPLFAPIILDAEVVVILGKVIEVRRTLS